MDLEEEENAADSFVPTAADETATDGRAPGRVDHTKPQTRSALRELQLRLPRRSLLPRRRTIFPRSSAPMQSSKSPKPGIASSVTLAARPCRNRQAPRWARRSSLTPAGRNRRRSDAGRDHAAIAGRVRAPTLLQRFEHRFIDDCKSAIWAYLRLIQGWCNSQGGRGVLEALFAKAD